MHLSETLPSPFTVPMVVASCAELSSLKHGQTVHDLAFKLGLFADNSAVGSSFIYFYSKRGETMDASRVFDEMLVRDVMAWTALVIGCVQNGEDEKCLDYFRQIHEFGEKPNFRTIQGGLQACGGSIGEVLKGRSLHGYAVKTGSGCSEFVQSSLLSMYSKCGRTEETHLAFREMPDKDLISWTNLIGSYARINSLHEYLKLFWEMLDLEVETDGIIISCLLSCFGKAGLVKEGKVFHGFIIRRNFEYEQIISGSLSMYLELGCLAIAEKLFNGMCKWDIESWEVKISWYAKLELGVKCIEL